ncbi:MAG: AbrB/MazE/SpoVT family DNA-binding domain-containing protein, partial [Candidatus Hadarchaeales archaeon]
MVEKKENRKIQLTGKSTYIVSLPKWWVSEMKLRAGDAVSVSVQDDMSLLITTAPVTDRFKKDEAVLNISPDEDPNRIARKLVSLYLVGYNTIRILSDRDRISPA